MLESREITVAQALELHAEAAESGILLLWTVTDGTKDYGDQYVARPHQINKERFGPAHIHLIADSLENLRLKLRALHLVRLDRHVKDEPIIVEVWL
jgi:hypothetical protein